MRLSERFSEYFISSTLGGGGEISKSFAYLESDGQKSCTSAGEFPKFIFVEISYDFMLKNEHFCKRIPFFQMK